MKSLNKKDEKVKEREFVVTGESNMDEKKIREDYDFFRNISYNKPKKVVSDNQYDQILNNPLPIPNTNYQQE